VEEANRVRREKKKCGDWVAKREQKKVSNARKYVTETSEEMRGFSGKEGGMRGNEIWQKKEGTPVRICRQRMNRFRDLALALRWEKGDETQAKELGDERKGPPGKYRRQGGSNRR